MKCGPRTARLSRPSGTARTCPSFRPEARLPPEPRRAAGAASGDIGAQAAQTAALNHAGVQAGAVSEMKCERDRDDGRTVYEIEFRAGGMEYEYEVDAATGTILKAESEYDD